MYTHQLNNDLKFYGTQLLGHYQLILVPKTHTVNLIGGFPRP